MKAKSAILGLLAFAVLFSGMASATECMTLATDKVNYDLGEDVIITITNEGKEAMSYTPAWITDAAGELAYAPDVLMFEVTLMPGESKGYTWDQTNGNSERVESGTYYVNTGWDSVEIRIKNKVFKDPTHKLPEFPGKKTFKIF